MTTRMVALNNLHSSSNDSSTHRSSARDDFMTRFLQDTNHNNTTNDEHHQLDSMNSSSTTLNDDSRIIPTLPIEMPAWDKEFSNGGDLVDNDNTNNSNDDELQELLREGEARARLDELIANVRRQGDDKRYTTELLDAHNTPTKKISTFDPSSMCAARRAELKKMKFDEEMAAAEEEARALSSFKALPLPGGVQVKNNPFASTQSFEMKQICSVEKMVRRDSKLHDQQVHNKSQQQHDASSSVCSTFGSGTEDSMMATTKISGSHTYNNTINTSFTNYSESYANEEDRERAKLLRTEKKMKKKQLLDAVNQTITAEDMNESLAGGDDEDVQSTTASHTERCYDVVEDPSKLRQDIARLEAKLKQKKTQRLAILNDIVDIDLDAPFDRLLSGSSGSGDDNDGILRIIDRLKKQVCGSVNDFQDVNSISLREDDEMSSYEKHTTRASLFERQEEWARQREQKLFEARLQSEANTMQGITGRPQLSHAARSWRKAKESHDTTLKRCAEIEERKQQEKEAKEKATNELKMKELEELQRQVSLAKLNKSSSIKSDNVNKEEQMKRLEMLSKPRQTREPHHHHDGASEQLEDNTVGIQQKTTSEIFGGSPPKPKQKPSKPFFSKSVGKRVIKTVHNILTSSPAMGTSANDDVKERQDELFHGKHSFSDMSDKEFAKLVRRIEKQAAMSSSAKMMKSELDK